MFIVPTTDMRSIGNLLYLLTRIVPQYTVLDERQLEGKYPDAALRTERVNEVEYTILSGSGVDMVSWPTALACASNVLVSRFKASNNLSPNLMQGGAVYCDALTVLGGILKWINLLDEKIYIFRERDVLHTGGSSSTQKGGSLFPDSIIPHIRTLNPPSLSTTASMARATLTRQANETLLTELLSKMVRWTYSVNAGVVYYHYRTDSNADLTFLNEDFIKVGIHLSRHA